MNPGKQVILSVGTSVLLVLGGFGVVGLGVQATSARTLAPPAQNQPVRAAKGVAAKGASAEQSGADTDNVQEGDQTSPDTVGEAGAATQAQAVASHARLVVQRVSGVAAATLPHVAAYHAAAPVVRAILAKPAILQVKTAGQIGTQGAADTDNVQQGDQQGSDTESAAGSEGSAGDAVETAALAGKAQITAQQAEQTALASRPGTHVLQSSLGDENGTIVYSVELSDGSDVKVNAQTGAITATDAAGGDTQQ